MNSEYNTTALSIYEILNMKENNLKIGANEESILDFEKENNIELPNEYKKLIRYSNGGELFDADVVFFSLEEIASNEQFKKMIAKNLLIVGKYNFGDLICFNLETENIVQWSNESNSIFIEHFGLKDFLISCIEEMNLIEG